MMDVVNKNMGSINENAETEVIKACAIARNIEDFDLLIEDMETELGAHWGGLNFDNANTILESDQAKDLIFITVAVDKQDEENLTPIVDTIRIAKSRNIKVILVAHNLSPMSLHQLMRVGADDFAPYPLPEGALHEAIERLSEQSAPPEKPTASQPAGKTHEGMIIAIYGVAGGVGATTLAVNLAHELQMEGAKEDKSVCLLDFGFLFGSVATYLDLPRKEGVFELLTEASAIDRETLKQAMITTSSKLDILTAPPEALPLDIVGAEEISRILEVAAQSYDHIIVDMPTNLVSWSEVVLERAQVFLAIMEVDMRSAQNVLRFLRALKSEDLPYEKVQFALNRAPKFTDMTGKGRVRRMAESLDIEFDFLLLDGGKAIQNAGDHGAPLAEVARKNPLRKQIRKIAISILEMSRSTADTP